MAKQHYPECERHRDGSPDCCICVRLEEHGHELLDNYFTDLRAKVEWLRDSHFCDLEVRHCHEGPAFAAVLDLIEENR